MLNVVEVDKYAGPSVDAWSLAQDWAGVLVTLRDHAIRAIDVEDREDTIHNALLHDGPAYWSHREWLTRTGGWSTGIGDYVTDVVRVSIVTVPHPTVAQVNSRTSWGDGSAIVEPGAYAIVSVGIRHDDIAAVILLSLDVDTNDAENLGEKAFYRCLESADVSHAEVGCGTCGWQRDTATDDDVDWSALSECLSDCEHGETYRFATLHCPECGGVETGTFVY